MAMDAGAERASNQTGSGLATGQTCSTQGDLAPALEQLEPWLRAPRAQRIVIGLVGMPGAGKSVLASRLAAAANQRYGAGVVVALGMDGFHLTRAQLAHCADPRAALARRGAPWTFDPLALAQGLRKVRQMPLTEAGAEGQQCRWPGFEHGVGDPVPDALAIPSATRLVMLEGLYLLHQQHGWNLDGLMHCCWFVDVGLDQALERLALRHMASRAITRQQAEQRIDTNDRLNAHTVLATRQRADWLVPAVCVGL